jgi:uncharacterized membrane protein YfcA
MFEIIDPLGAAYGTVCIFLAAIVRGYSGFGFSMLAVISLSLLLPPAETVPTILMLEVAASLHLLPKIWKEVHWRSVGWLLAGCIVATPIGTWLLASMPAPPMQLALSICVLAAAILLAQGFALRSTPGTAATFGTGLASGVLNGSFGIGGPPVILFYFSTPAAIDVSRASIIAYFLGTDLAGLGFLGLEGLVTPESLLRFALFLPALVVGVAVGHRSFKGADPTAFRRWVLRLLMALAVLSALRALYDWQPG